MNEKAEEEHMPDKLEDIISTLLARTQNFHASGAVGPISPAGAVCPVGGAAAAAESAEPSPAPEPASSGSSADPAELSRPS